MDERETPIARKVRSYVLRAGRLTRGQQRALDELLPVYGLDLPAANAGAPDFHKIFARVAPLRMEIGFGDGDALIELAEKNPGCDFIGVEVHRPGIGRLLQNLNARRITNVRIFCDDAIAVLTYAIADSALDAIYLYFPDPWPKKRHHKRRLLQPPFITLAAKKLIRGGCLHFATDWQQYAEHALACLQQSKSFENAAGQNQFHPRPPDRPQTKFERRGKKLGHDVWDIVLRKVG